MNRLSHLVSLVVFAATAAALAQHPQTIMGTLSTHDAQINGGMQVRGEQADLLSNDSITAFGHTAPITLTRGGQVLVCSTSQFHLLRTGSENALLFGLDRGALELHGPVDVHDILITPDIRFSLEDAGTAQSPKTYDLSLRVTPSGDTCVQNAGVNAPVLILADPFSSTTYRLIPGQHVLFEHGSLREVVDNERSNCGCPAEAPPRPSPPPSAPTHSPQPPAQASSRLLPSRTPPPTARPTPRSTPTSATPPASPNPPRTHLPHHRQPRRLGLHNTPANPSRPPLHRPRH
ncbi:nuclease [Granulicella sp. 5B5]|uniref:nuclease n=1 Tax=Granulicella sp. 5B5 TaxID=1617967 RepID=UPI0015F522D5|nr:nuclease [Granulicella sp. 5B5]QMV19230.1 nuclease [Granulicella sp. 5B5]